MPSAAAERGEEDEELMRKQAQHLRMPQKARVYDVQGRLVGYDRSYDPWGADHDSFYEPPEPPRARTTSTPGSPRAESTREDPLLSAFLMLAGAVGGESADKLADAQCERGHRAVSAGGQLPINGSPGYRDRGSRGMEPVVLEGAEERLEILKQWLVHPDLPREDVGRVEYQIGALTEDLERARVWRELGFEFGAPVDDLFRQVKFPEGWKRRSTDHAMYSDFVDERGRKRISMFYKSAFYDREAFMHYVRRFSVARDYSNSDVIRVRVLDCDKEVFSAEPVDLPDPKRFSPEYVHRREAIEAEQRAACCAWLDEHYPESNDPAAYWDLP